MPGVPTCKHLIWPLPSPFLNIASCANVGGLIVLAPTVTLSGVVVLDTVLALLGRPPLLIRGVYVRRPCLRDASSCGAMATRILRGVRLVPPPPLEIVSLPDAVVGRGDAKLT